MPVSGASTNAVATAVHATARTDACSPMAAATAATVAAGANTRRAVSDTGWGISVAARPAAHPTHSPTEATVRTGTAAPPRAWASAGPAVNGRAAHQARRIQGKRRRTVGGSTGGAKLRSSGVKSAADGANGGELAERNGQTRRVDGS